MDVYFDSETRSTLDLTKVGVHRYARCPDTDVICTTWAKAGDGKVKLWKRGELPPPELMHAVGAGARCFAHNMEFDFVIWNEVLARRHGWTRLPVEQIRCTASM